MGEESFLPEGGLSSLKRAWPSCRAYARAGGPVPGRTAGNSWSFEEGVGPLARAPLVVQE
jgi:hypothetical protein